MLAPGWHTRHLVAWLALAATIGGGVACSGGPGGGAEPYRFVPLAVPYNLYGVRADLSWAPRLDSRIPAATMRRVGG